MKNLYLILCSALFFLACASSKENSISHMHVNDQTGKGYQQNRVVEDSAISDYDSVPKLISDEELLLYNLITFYRSEHNLPVIPLSVSLTSVAQQHCKDLVENKPDIASPDCNAHSWSDKGKWTSCCYTPDHAQASCIWNKPAEMTAYTGYGFEIACGSSDPIYDAFIMTADYALESWKQSTGHNNVILNKDVWTDYTWLSIGVGIEKGFATVWFGKEIDPAGTIDTKIKE